MDPLNTKIQSIDQMVSHKNDHWRTFARILVMFCSQLEKSDFTHIPSMSILNSASTEAHVSAINGLREEFTRRFQDLSTHSSKFDVLQSPYLFLLRILILLCKWN